MNNIFVGLWMHMIATQGFSRLSVTGRIESYAGDRFYLVKTRSGVKRLVCAESMQEARMFDSREEMEADIKRIQEKNDKLNELQRQQMKMQQMTATEYTRDVVPAGLED